ncbi:hypothetical protein IEQ34_004532 [Dendrobium chrysotoxum]|uniref:Uncharacterized protein n=1 Tax=Dendrobium chrysotoxum TaxID=161865 RepID=A0AAV7H0H1_DENCH|nr:hypothetical protein IEQ34_004532 [Dendrobium chrysotoxum]
MLRPPLLVDSLIIIYIKIHFPNDLVACLPPPGYLIIFESSLRAGLRFSPHLELIDISARCGSYVSDDGTDCILQRLRSHSDT